jgi:hypothetical protein
MGKDGFEPTGAHISVDDRTVLVISTLVSAASVGLERQAINDLPELTRLYGMIKLNRDVSNLLNRFTKA